MSPGARLTTLEAVPMLKAAVISFGEELKAVLAELEIELGRASEWINHDRSDYWRHQIRRNNDLVSELRITLERAMLFKNVDGTTPTCYDERKALARAKQQLSVAEEKVEIVRRWQRTIERESLEFRGVLNQLAGWVQSDYPRAVALIDRMRASLESYLNVTTAKAGENGAVGAPPAGAPATEATPAEPTGEAKGAADASV